MTSPRHIAWFLALGSFWGLSPTIYRQLAEFNVPIAHIVAITGLAVGLVLFFIATYKFGNWRVPRATLGYGIACGFLLNLPFAINLYLAALVPPTELAIIITLAPLFNYIAALVTGAENAAARRLLAILFGLASTLVLILSRNSMSDNGPTWALLSAILIPALYCLYNFYGSIGWPKNANPLQAGAVESIASGLFAIPFVAWAGSSGVEDINMGGYVLLAATSFMWVVERIAYFTLISEKGAVYTGQATYLSTPIAVMIAAAFFGGGNDHWLWVSLALLMVALWLNNTGRSVNPKASIQPSS